MAKSYDFTTLEDELNFIYSTKEEKKNNKITRKLKHATIALIPTTLLVQGVNTIASQASTTATTVATARTVSEYIRDIIVIIAPIKNFIIALGSILAALVTILVVINDLNEDKRDKILMHVVIGVFLMIIIRRTFDWLITVSDVAAEMGW